MIIDHIDGEKSNNRADNLRSVTASDNARNMPISVKNTSGHLGVRYRSRFKRWEAHINPNGSSKYLGMFASKEEAIAARKKAERDLGFHPNHGRPAAKKSECAANGVEQGISP